MAPAFPGNQEDVFVLQQASQQWNAGNQAGALDVLRPRADANAPWAAALMAWLYVQQGIPGFPESVHWAIRAAELGAPWQTIQTFNNVIGNIPSVPHLAERLPELLQWAAPWTGGIDLVGQGWNLVAQGQPELAMRIMTTPPPGPLSEPQLNALADQARARISELDGLLSTARKMRDDFDVHVTQSSTSIEEAKNDLTTSAKQAGLLVSTVLSDATNTLYKDDATRNERESKGAWISGLFILGLAALAAVLPVGMHYLGLGPDYSRGEVIAVHLASTAALGSFAGVLLARARSRDHAAQRAHDLSTAMGTMISYSNQISNPVEKERFMMTMGQVVMQAHLSSGSGPKSSEDSLPGILALGNALRASNPAGPTTPN